MSWLSGLQIVFFLEEHSRKFCVNYSNLQANFSNIVALWFMSQSAAPHLEQKQRVITEINLLFYHGEFMEGLSALTATKQYLTSKFSTLPLLLSRWQLSASENTFLPLAWISSGWTEYRVHIKNFCKGTERDSVWWSPLFKLGGLECWEQET